MSLEDDLNKIRDSLRGFDYAGCTRHIAQALEAMGYAKPAPLAWDANSNRRYEPVESRAKEIYDAFEYDGPAGTSKPKWAEGGNGLKQDEARFLARAELRQAGHQPSYAAS